MCQTERNTPERIQPDCAQCQLDPNTQELKFQVSKWKQFPCVADSYKNPHWPCPPTTLESWPVCLEALAYPITFREAQNLLCPNSAISKNWAKEWGIRVGGRRLKTRAEALLKWAVNLEVFISRFCGTIELSMGLAGGPFAHGHYSEGPQEAVKSWFSAEAQVNRSAHCTAPSLCTYSGTSPKPGAARASAAKILQYSRLMFWILHPCGLKGTNSDQQGSIPVLYVPGS